VRYIASSNFAAWQLCEALWTSISTQLESFCVIQCQYNLLDRRIERELVPCCENYRIGIIPFSPLASGFLTGKYERGKPVPEGSRLGRMQSMRSPGTPAIGGQFRRGSILSDANFDKLEKWQEFAKAHDHTMEELAIAWLLSHPYIDSVIAGATNPEQVSSHVAAAEWKLPAKEFAEFEKSLEDE